MLKFKVVKHQRISESSQPPQQQQQPPPQQQQQIYHQQQQLGGGGGGGGGEGGEEEEALLVVCDAAPARPLSVSSRSSTTTATTTTATTTAMSGHPAGGEHDGGGTPPSPVPQNAKGSRKLQNFGKRSHSIRRNPNAPVTIRGWLHKQDSTGMRLWKKRWFVLSDFCLFYYKDDKEEGVLGSISLPSFQVNPVEADDKINRKFAFKARHAGMRTYCFGADSPEGMRVWMEAMVQASQLQTEIPQRDHSRGGRRAAEEEQEGGGLARPQAGTDADDPSAEAADRPTAGAAILRPGAAATSGLVLRHPNSQETQQQPQPQQTRLQMQRHSTGGTGLAGSSGLSALNRDGFGYGAALALERERRCSLAQLEKWMMRSQQQQHEGERWSIASIQTLPRSMPSYRRSLALVGGAPYPDGFTSLPRRDAAASSSLSRRPPAAAAATAAGPYGAGGGVGGSAGALSAPHRLAVSNPPALCSSSSSVAQAEQSAAGSCRQRRAEFSHGHGAWMKQLTRLCDHNKTPHEQETRLRQLRNEKARIEWSLQGLHLQITQRRSQPELLHEQQQQQQQRQQQQVFTSLDGLVPPPSQPGQMQSATVASYVTLPRGPKERPAVGRPAVGAAGRGKMSAEEQLERLKLNQKVAGAPGGWGRSARGRTMTRDCRNILTAQSPARAVSVDVSQLVVEVSRRRKHELDVAELDERAVQDVPAVTLPRPLRVVTSVQNDAARGEEREEREERIVVVGLACALAAEARQRSKAAKFTSQDAWAPGGGRHSTLV